MRCSKLLAPAAAAFRIDDDRDMEEDDCEAVAAFRGPRRQGGINAGGAGWVVSGCTASKAGTVSSGSSSSSLFSSTSSLTDQEEEEDGDGATSGCRPDRDVSSSSLSSLTSSGSETVQTAGPIGPLDALSTMLEDLPALRLNSLTAEQGYPSTTREGPSPSHRWPMSAAWRTSRRRRPLTSGKRRSPGATLKCWARRTGCQRR